MLQIKDLNGLVTVNKQTALQILDITTSDTQRMKDLKKVAKLADSMRAGEWLDKGECIIIATNGARLDGNHRLHAVIEADTDVKLRFINDVEAVQNDKEIFIYIDSETRKPYDVLSIEYKDLKHTKEVTKLIGQLEAFALQALYTKVNGIKLRNDTILKYAEKHRPLSTLDNFVDRGITLADRSGTAKGKSVKARLLNHTELALFTATIGVCTKGNEFLEILVGLVQVDDGIINRRMGHVLDENDPLAKCVTVINDIRHGDKDHKTARIYAVVFSAYDHFVNGITMVEKKLVQSRIEYPVDYDRYTEV